MILITIMIINTRCINRTATATGSSTSSYSTLLPLSTATYRHLQEQKLKQRQHHRLGIVIKRPAHIEIRRILYTYQQRCLEIEIITTTNCIQSDTNVIVLGENSVIKASHCPDI